MFNRKPLVTNSIKSDDLIRHGSIMVIASMLAGLFNYLYQLAMGIMLDSVQYGVVTTLIALFTIASILPQTIQIATAKFISNTGAQYSPIKANYLWRFFLKRSSLAGMILLFALCLFIPFFSRFLDISNYWYLIILFATLTIIFTLYVNHGTLQGLQRFLPFAFSSDLFFFLRLSLAMLLVHLGFGVYGALLPFLLSAVIVFGISTYFLRDIAHAGTERIELNGLYNYAGLAFLASAAFLVLTNLDIVLVKHYLNDEITGNYAVISVLGKIALFLPAGIVLAMFPKTAALSQNGGNHRQILKKATLLTLLLSCPVVIAYWLIPDFITELLYNDKYPLAAPQLFKYALAMTLFALSYLLINYLLSIGKTKVAYPILLSMILQLILIIFFHSDISQVINAILISGITCFVSLLFFLKFLTNPNRL